MQEIVASPLATWENFYVIVGSSAGALTGLMFVVIALIADTGTPNATPEADEGSLAAFGTPTVVHFCVVLFIAAVLSAPWHALTHPSLLLGATGLGGAIYVVIVVLRARRQTGYKPVFEDWLFHVLLPAIAYATVFVAAFMLVKNPPATLFAVAGAGLLLMFIGIHNSWDTVTWLALRRVQERRRAAG